MWRGHPSRIAVVGLAVIVFVVCCVLPVAYLLATLLGSSNAAYEALLLDQRQRGLLVNTAVLGTGTALLATVIGVPLGVVLARVPLRHKALLRVIAAAPIVLPPYVTALAWVYLGSARGILSRVGVGDVLVEWAYSLPAAVLVLSFSLFPLSMLATELALRRVDGRLEEAALLVAPPRRVLRCITLPLAGPSVLAAALVIFVMAVSEFGVPGLLQVRVYTTEVFTAFAALYDVGRAVLLAVPLLLVCVAVAAMAALLLRDRLITSSRATGVSPVTFVEWRRPAAITIVLVISVTLALPTVVLLREAIGARSIGAALSGSGGAIANSLLFAAVGATMVVAVAVWLGYAQARARRQMRLVTQILWVVLFAMPSTIVGVGLIALWNRPGVLGDVYGTDVMFLLAYMARLLPVAALILAAVTSTVPLSQEEAAAVSGAGWLRTMRGIVLPQMRRGLAAAWVMVFVLAFGELGTSIMIAPAGEATLPIRIYTIIANTSPSTIAALALLQSLVIVLPMAALVAAARLREAR